MRLPYIQVAMEVIEQAAPDIAVELEADEAIIGWGLVKMIRWALGRCPDNAPPSANSTVKGAHAARQIARAAGYAGDPEAFVDAVARVQPAPLLERIEGGIRIRGLDRYDAAWGKANPAKWAEWKAAHPTRYGPAPKPGRNSPGTGSEPSQVGAGNGPPDADADTDAEGTSKRSPPRAREVSSSPEASPLPSSEGQMPKPLGIDPEAIAWFAWHEEVWRLRFPSKAFRPPERGGFASWYAQARAELGRTNRGDQQLRDGYLAFLQNQRWVPDGCPWAAWLKQWNEFVDRAAIAPASKPKRSTNGF